MSFQLVSKSVTLNPSLNDLEQRNDPYIALFHRIFMYDVVVIIIRFISGSKSTFDIL